MKSTSFEPTARALDGVLVSSRGESIESPAVRSIQASNSNQRCCLGSAACRLQLLPDSAVIDGIATDRACCGTSANRPAVVLERSGFVPLQYFKSDSSLPLVCGNP